MKDLLGEWVGYTKYFSLCLLDTTYYKDWWKYFKEFAVHTSIFPLKIVATLLSPIFAILQMISDRKDKKRLEEAREDRFRRRHSLAKGGVRDGEDYLYL